MQDKDYDFPVGDDPANPEVIRYWSAVAARMRLMALPRDLDGWPDAIQDRITTYQKRRAEFDAITRQFVVEEGESLTDVVIDLELEARFRKARSELRWAEAEFPRLKWKLSAHFGRHYDLSGPVVMALFARAEEGEGN